MEFNFGEKMKALRKKSNFTQEQMAEFLGVSSQAISKWETNISYPDISLLPTIANFYGVSTDELLGVDVSKRDESINALCGKADRLSSEKRYAEELSLMRKAVIDYPGNDKLMYRLTWALTGNIKENPDYLDEAINVYLKILEISTDTEIRAKVTRDLIHRYYTKEDIDTATEYVNQLPAFEVCREYNMGRANLLNGKSLAIYLQNNIRLFGNAMIECLEYFLNDKIISKEDMMPLTPRKAANSIAQLKQILE